MSDHVCTQQDNIADTKATVKDIHKRLFVDNGVDSFQTMFRKGTARMDAIEVEISVLSSKLIAHEERPKKVLGIVAIVIPIVLAVGGAVYYIGCWFIDHFQWRAS